MDYQWYPGHMTKARRRMQESLKQIDLVIELTDARCVLSGRNPDIDELAQAKDRLLLLTKADLADEKINRAWIAYFREKGILCAAVDARNSGSVKQLRPLIQEACRKKTERDRKRGILNRPVRAMIAGIPNVGKSSLINALSGKGAAKTGNKPGVTRGEQWIRPDKSIELLDTPGILWPRFEDPDTGLRLALTGTIKDELLEPVSMAVSFLSFLQETYPDALPKRYALAEEADPQSVLVQIAKSRSLVKSGSEPDTERAARTLIEDFRSGRLGKISLEFPDGVI